MIFHCQLKQQLRLFLRYLTLTSGFALAGLLEAQPTPQRFLRIETGMHTSAISKIDVDSARQYLVSASHDGTARVWDLRSGKPLRTLRSTSAARAALDIASVAISPDGNVVAVAALGSVLLFDRASGRLIHSLYLGPKISYVVFSPDGRFLAIGEYGITVFRISDYSQVFHDPSESSSETLGVDFDKNGRLVTCSGKTLRLYDKDFKLIAARPAPSSDRPFSVRFSPDGTKIAIGSIHADRVDVVSGADLQLVVSHPALPVSISLRAGVNLPPLPGHLQGPAAENIGASVCWSQDGTKLYAACGYKVRSFRNDTEGTPDFTVRDLAAGGVVTSIQSMPDGVAFSVTRPGWGTLTDEGKTKLFVRSSTVNFWKNPIQLSKNGEIIEFRFLSNPDDPPAVFDIQKRRLSSAADLPPLALLPPITKADGLDLSDYDNGASSAKLNGRPLVGSGSTRCLAIASDGQMFLIGATTESKLYGRDGTLKQRIRAPIGAEVLSANITGDGRTCVIGYSDGTIRWYQLSDGKELLAFFPHADRARWVLFTPSGYYDCSPDGEELLGWQVSAGTQQAPDFFPASHFRDTFYRPDLTTTALQPEARPTPGPTIAEVFPSPSGSPSSHLPEASPSGSAIAKFSPGPSTSPLQVSSDPLKHLPPIIWITAPSDNTNVSDNQVDVHYAFRTTSGDPVRHIRALIDNRPTEAVQDLNLVTVQDKSGTILVTVPNRDCQVSLVAESDFEKSNLATVALHWTGVPAEIKPNLYLLTIGVAHYKNDQDLQLNFPAKDAQDFGQIMLRQQTRRYQQVEIKTLLDPSRKEILNGFDWIRQKTTPNDIAMVFMSGHGTNDESYTWYFLPTDYLAEELRGTGIMAAELAKIIKDTHSRAFIFFLDSCFSGNAMVGNFYDINRAVMELADPNIAGAVVFSGSEGSQESQEHKEWQNGAFTKVLVEGLGGAADLLRDGSITVSTLDAYVSKYVKRLTKGQQVPFTRKQSIDLAIACLSECPP